MEEKNIFLIVMGYLYKGYTLSITSNPSNGVLILRENDSHETPSLSIKDLIEIDTSTIIENFPNITPYIENSDMLEIWFERGVFVSRIASNKTEEPYGEETKRITKRSLESTDDSMYMSLYGLAEKIKEDKIKTSSQNPQLVKRLEN